MTLATVVWLNGPFGVGKSAVARELRARLPGAVVLEPDWLGAMLRTMLTAPSGDFQDLAAWRAVAARTAVAVAEEAGGPVLVPMSVLRQAYAREILGAVRAAGVRVVHAVLHAEPEALRRRIAADAEDRGARGWRERHLDAYAGAGWLRGVRPWVDTTAASPAEAAERVRAALAEPEAPAPPGWTVAGLDDVEAVPWPGGLTWHPVRMTLGLGAFGAGGFTARRAGDVVVEPHDEARDGRAHEELYVVLAGRARFTLDGARADVPAGRFVFVRDPAVRREAVALEGGTAVLALGGPRGFEPGGSEWLMRARPLLRAGEVARARELVEAGRRAAPESPGVAFAAALVLSAEGRRREAAEVLGWAVNADPRLAAEARAEPLLAGLP